MSKLEKEILKAYVFLIVKLGSTNDVLSKLKLIPGVVSVAVITGEYDVVARVETETMADMFNISQEIHLIDGILETNTAIIQKEF